MEWRVTVGRNNCAKRSSTFSGMEKRERKESVERERREKRAGQIRRKKKKDGTKRVWNGVERRKGKGRVGWGGKK